VAFQCLRGAAEALQADGGIAQFDIDLLVRPDPLVVEHQRAAETVRIVVAAVEEFDLFAGDVIGNEAGEPQVAGNPAEGEVEDRPERQVLSDRKIPADAAAERKADPLDGDRARLLPIGGDERRIEAAVGDAALQVERPWSG
jgi:hypothetical protein